MKTVLVRDGVRIAHRDHDSRRFASVDVARLQVELSCQLLASGQEPRLLGTVGMTADLQTQLRESRYSMSALLNLELGTEI